MVFNDFQDYVGFKLAPSWPTLAHVCPCWPELAPSWPQLGPSLSKFAKLAPSKSQVSPKLAACWPMLGQVGPKMGPSWPMLAPVGPSWPPKSSKMATSWPMLAHVGPKLAPCKASPRLAKASTKAQPLRRRFSKMSTKALPQAFRRLIVRSDCSILFLSILQVVSLCCFFQHALSWQVFQNDLFKRSSQVVLVGSCILKFHPFSCIARRHSSSIYINRPWCSIDPLGKIQGRIHGRNFKRTKIRKDGSDFDDFQTKMIAPSQSSV